jgi:U-box domain
MTDRTEDHHDMEAGFSFQLAQHKKLQLCRPLTKEPFREPVVHPIGQTYELEAIKEQLVNVHCYPNRALKEYLDPHTEDSNGIFYCPITHTLLRDPVIDPEGYTFERHIILNWIQNHGASPITRTPIQANQLYDNSIIILLLLQTILQSSINNHNNYNTTNEEIEEWKQEMSRFATAEPSLPLSELKQALQPPLPNPLWKSFDKLWHRRPFKSPHSRTLNKLSQNLKA